MSRNGPAPQRNLHRSGNAVSRDRQAPPTLQQGFVTTDPRHEIPERGDSSSDNTPSHGRHAGECAVDGDSRRPRFTVQQSAPGSSPEPGLPQHPRNLVRFNPMDARTAFVDRGTTYISKVSHPACLIPGYRATPQEAHQSRDQVIHAIRFPSASARISDAEPPSLVSATVQLFQHVLPPDFNAGNDFGGNCRNSHASTATAGGTTLAKHRPHCGPPSEDCSSIPSTQGTGSRYSAETRPVPTAQHPNSRADTVQDGTLGVLTSEEDGAMWGKVVLRGDGYRINDAQHHPEVSQRASVEIQRATAAVEVPEYVIRPGRQARGSNGDPAQIEQHIPAQTASSESSSISSTETQPSTTPAVIDCSSSSTNTSTPSFFSPPSPPPRVTCDLVARNAFLAANIFHFESDSIGRHSIIENREESSAVDCEGRAEASARRISLRWGEELVDKLRFEIRTIGLEENHGR